MDRFVTRAETEPREDGSAVDRPPEGRAGHRAGGKDTESTGQFRVPRWSRVWRREDGEREIRRRMQAGANAWRAVEGVMADRRISKKTERQGHEHLCHTSMPVRNGNLGSDRTTTTQAASVRKQLGPKNSKSNESRQAKNGGVKGRDGSAVELDRENGEEQITVGWTRRKDGQ